MTTTCLRGRRDRFARPNLPAMDAAAAGLACGSGAHFSQTHPAPWPDHSAADQPGACANTRGPLHCHGRFG